MLKIILFIVLIFKVDSFSVNGRGCMILAETALFVRSSRCHKCQGKDIELGSSIENQPSSCSYLLLNPHHTVSLE